MKLLLKLVFIAGTLASGLAYAQPMPRHGIQDRPPRHSVDDRGHHEGRHHREPTIKTGYDGREAPHGYRTKRMSAYERYRLRNQIREAGRMDFYR